MAYTCECGEEYPNLDKPPHRCRNEQCPTRKPASKVQAGAFIDHLTGAKPTPFSSGKSSGNGTPLGHTKQSAASEKTSPQSSTATLTQPVVVSREEVAQAQALLKTVKQLTESLKTHFDLAKEMRQALELEISLQEYPGPAVETLTQLKSELSDLIDEQNSHSRFQKQSNVLLLELRSKLSVDAHNDLVDEYNLVNRDKSKTKATAAEQLHNRFKELNNPQPQPNVQQQEQPQPPKKPDKTPQSQPTATPKEPQQQTTPKQQPTVEPKPTTGTNANEFESLRKQVFECYRQLILSDGKWLSDRTTNFNPLIKKDVSPDVEKMRELLMRLQRELSPNPQSTPSFKQASKSAAQSTTPTPKQEAPQKPPEQPTVQPVTDQTAEKSQSGKQASEQATKAEPQQATVNEPQPTPEQDEKAKKEAAERERVEAAHKAEEEKARQLAEQKRQEQALAAGQLQVQIEQLEKDPAATAQLQALGQLKQQVMGVAKGTDGDAMQSALATHAQEYETLKKAVEVARQLAEQKRQAQAKAASELQSQIEQLENDPAAKAQLQALVQLKQKVAEVVKGTDGDAMQSALATHAQEYDALKKAVEVARQLAERKRQEQALAAGKLQGQIEQLENDPAATAQLQALVQLKQQVMGVAKGTDGDAMQSALNTHSQEYDTLKKAVELARQLAEQKRKEQAAAASQLQMQIEQLEKNPVAQAQLVALGQLRLKVAEVAKGTDGDAMQSALNTHTQEYDNLKKAVELAEQKRRVQAEAASQLQVRIEQLENDPAATAQLQALVQLKQQVMGVAKGTDGDAMQSALSTHTQQFESLQAAVEIARQFAKARAVALVKYKAGEQVKQALVKLVSDSNEVANALVELQKVANELEQLRLDETKPGTDIDGVVKRIGEELVKVENARRLAAEEAERKRLEEAARQQAEQQAKQQTANTPQPKPSTPPTVEGVREQATKLGLPEKEQEFLKGLATSSLPVAKSLADAVDSTLQPIPLDESKIQLAVGKVAVAERKILEAANKASEAERKIQLAAGGVSGAQGKVQLAAGKVSVAEGKVDEEADKIRAAKQKIQAADKTISTADATIRKANTEIDAARLSQKDSLKALNDVLWNKLPREAQTQENVDVFNRLNTEAFEAWNSGNQALAVDLRRQNFNFLKSLSNNAGLTALKFSASAKTLADGESKQAVAESSKVQANESKASAEQGKAGPRQEQETAEREQGTAQQEKEAAEREQAEAQREKQTAEREQAEAQREKQTAEREQAEARQEKLTAEQEQVSTREAAEREQAAAQEAAAKAGVRLLNTVRFGPLAQPPIDYTKVTGLKPEEVQQRQARAAKREEAVAAITKSFKDFPELALDALDILAEAEHPEVFLQGLEKVGALQKGNFGGQAGSPQETRAMTRNALKMGGVMGGDFFDRMGAYYENNPAAKQPDPNRETGEAATQKTTLKYTAALGTALLDPTGNLTPNGAGVLALRDNLQFHPDSLKNPLPVFAKHLDALRGSIGKDPTGFKNALDTVNPPVTGAAPDLVRQTLNLGNNHAVTAKDAKVAVLSALATPLTQGPVGSCFATCNCMDFQEKNPVGLLKDLAHMVNTGELEKGGDSVPVVVNIPPNEHKLLRGWEYTVATLGANTVESSKKENLAVSFGNVFVVAGNKANGVGNLPPNYQQLEALHPALAQAKRRYTEAVRVRNALVPLYNDNNALYATQLDEATRERDEALLAKTTAEQDWSSKTVAAKTAVRDALKYRYDPTKPQAGVGADGSSSLGGWTYKNANGQEVASKEDYHATMKAVVQTALGPNANVDSFMETEAFKNELKGQWATTGGGAAESKALLSGEAVESTQLFDHKAHTSSDKETKTKALLSGLVDGLKNSDGDTVTLSVPNHAERALPKHPSLDVLKTDGGDVAALVEAAFEKAKTTATTPLDPAQLSNVYDKAVEKIIADLFDGDLGNFAKPEKRPTGEKTPAELKAAILDNAAAKITQMVDQNISANLNDPNLNTKSKLRKYYTDELSGKVDALLVKELFADAQFVIADTNWGDAGEKYTHVVAPNPDTGEPQLWKKAEFSGDFTVAPDKWVGDEWKAMTTNNS